MGVLEQMTGPTHKDKTIYLFQDCYIKERALDVRKFHNNIDISLLKEASVHT